MNLRTIKATRYVTPLREGGSLPAIIEADDDGMYVLKFRGAGQGTKALIAELVSGELARAAGLLVPEIVFVDFDPEMARSEPDPEIQDLLKASEGINLALDYLPGSVMFDPVAEKPISALASSIVWFDSFVTNVDRTPRNANMLMWHKKLWLIDHGASLYFHHSWKNYKERSLEPFNLIKDHVLLRFAESLHDADILFKNKVSEESIIKIIELIPDDWLKEEPAFGSKTEIRTAYIEYLINRLNHSYVFLEEAVSARSIYL